MDKNLQLTGFSTAAIHSGHITDSEYAHLTPIYASSTFVFDEAEQGMRRFSGKEEGFIYSRWGNPSFREAEEKIAAMETFGTNQRVKGILHSSGMAAISTLMIATLKTGDKVLSHYSLYGGTQELLNRILPPLGMEGIIADLRDLFDEIQQTAVYVTHDVAEAFALGNRVAVLRAGRIVQIAAPERLWAAPADAWIARFIGLENVEERGQTSFVTHPEGVVLRPAAGGNAVVVAALRDGPVVTLRARYDDGREIVSAHAGLAAPAPGSRVDVQVDRAAVIEVPTDLALD